jgi:hypothetical protein
VIESASLKEHKDGTGNVSLHLRDGNNIAYLRLWPHARPWRFKQAEPTLREVPDAGHVATVLADALQSFVKHSDGAQAGTEASQSPQTHGTGSRDDDRRMPQMPQQERASAAE